MKTLELNLRKDLLLVELPEVNSYSFTSYGIFMVDHTISEGYKIEGKPICRASELTEEMASEWVERIAVEKWLNYNEKKYFNNQFDTALESFRSAVEAKGWYFENPLFKPRWDEIAPTEYPHDYQEAEAKWREAQSSTFDLNRTLIFEKL